MVEFTIDKIDIKTMSEVTGIPVGYIELGLDIPLEVVCQSTTFKEVLKANLNARYGSKEEVAALKKGIELAGPLTELEASLLKERDKFCLEDLEEATTIEEIKKVYLRSFPGSKAQAAAIRKLATFFPKK